MCIFTKLIKPSVTEVPKSNESVETTPVKIALSTVIDSSIKSAILTNNSYTYNGVAYIDVVYQVTSGGSSAPHDIITGLPKPKSDFTFSCCFFTPDNAANQACARVYCEGDECRIAIQYGAAAPKLMWHMHTSYLLA